MTPMGASRHCYLFVLEVAPLEVGKVYGELPLHCTLAHRLWMELSSEELSNKVCALFEATPPVGLTTYERTVLGPKQVPVSLIKHTDELVMLNIQMHDLLNGLGATHTQPEYSGEGHIFHVTDRENARAIIGTMHVSNAVYLIEVKVPGHEGQRIVRGKFLLHAGKAKLI